MGAECAILPYPVHADDQIQNQVHHGVVIDKIVIPLAFRQNNIPKQFHIIVRKCFLHHIQAHYILIELLVENAA